MDQITDQEGAPIPAQSLLITLLPRHLFANVADALSDGFVDSDDSRSGDMIGAIADIEAHPNGMVSATDISDFIVATEQGPRVVQWRELPDHQKAPAAVASMLMKTRWSLSMALSSLFEELSAGDGEVDYYRMFFTRQGCLLSRADAQDQIIGGRYTGEEIDNRIIDECLRVIMPSDGDTAHIRASVLRLARQILPLADMEALTTEYGDPLTFGSLRFE